MMVGPSFGPGETAASYETAQLTHTSVVAASQDAGEKKGGAGGDEKGGPQRDSEARSR